MVYWYLTYIHKRLGFREDYVLPPKHVNAGTFGATRYSLRSPVERGGNRIRRPLSRTSSTAGLRLRLVPARVVVECRSLRRRLLWAEVRGVCQNDDGVAISNISRN